MDDRQFPSWLRRPTMMAANSMYLLAVAGSSLGGVALVALAEFFTGGPLTRDAALAQSVVLELLFFLLPTVVYAARHRGVHLALRLNPPPLPLMVLGALAGALMALLGQALGTWWVLLIEALGGRPISNDWLVPGDVDHLIRMAAPIAIVPGVCEEVLFRGTILGAWERGGSRRAIVASALLFAAMHPLSGLPVYVLAGLMLGYVAVASGSLYVSMAMHATYNLTALGVALYADRMMRAMDPAAAAAPVDASSYVVLAIGGLVLAALFFGAMLPFIERMRQRRLAAPPPDSTREGMDWPEYIVLAVGIASAALMYALELYQMFGPAV
ncbi:MAG: CPBP family intramembrane metalloprotease [Clostridiales bacterium]|nr:CPBP family intramembrane metalloprotease [Clostridiales bacterium]